MGIMSIDLKELYYWKRVYGNGDGEYMGDDNNNGKDNNGFGK